MFFHMISNLVTLLFIWWRALAMDLLFLNLMLLSLGCWVVGSFICEQGCAIGIAYLFGNTASFLLIWSLLQLLLLRLFFLLASSRVFILFNSMRCFTLHLQAVTNIFFELSKLTIWQLVDVKLKNLLIIAWIHVLHHVNNTMQIFWLELLNILS